MWEFGLFGFLDENTRAAVVVRDIILVIDTLYVVLRAGDS